MHFRVMLVPSGCMSIRATGAVGARSIVAGPVDNPVWVKGYRGFRSPGGFYPGCDEGRQSKDCRDATRRYARSERWNRVWKRHGARVRVRGVLMERSWIRSNQTNRHLQG